MDKKDKLSASGGKKSDNKNIKRLQTPASSILADDDNQKIIDQKKVDKKKEVKEVTECGAKARFLRISSSKVRLVINEIRGLMALDALNRLKLINKGSVSMVIKLLNSAMANAENNFKLKKEDLYIKHIVANQGPTLNRWKPAAFGRATPIRKRTSHIEIILAVKNDNKESVKQSKRKNIKKSESVKDSNKKEEKKI